MIDDWCVLIMNCRWDYALPTSRRDYYHVLIRSTWLHAGLDDYKDCYIPNWIYNSYSYFVELRLFSSTGCLDSELL